MDLDIKLLDKNIDRMMPELGFGPDDNDRLVASYSGGWQMRMCLGKILLQVRLMFSSEIPGLQHISCVYTRPASRLNLRMSCPSMVQVNADAAFWEAGDMLFCAHVLLQSLPRWPIDAFSQRVANQTAWLSRAGAGLVAA